MMKSFSSWFVFFYLCSSAGGLPISGGGSGYALDLLPTCCIYLCSGPVNLAATFSHAHVPYDGFLDVRRQQQVLKYSRRGLHLDARALLEHIMVDICTSRDIPLTGIVVLPLFVSGLSAARLKAKKSLPMVVIQYIIVAKHILSTIFPTLRFPHTMNNTIQTGGHE